MSTPPLDPYNAFIEAVGIAYHEESQSGGPMMPCRLEYGQFLDFDNYCECFYVGWSIARRVMASPALREDFRIHPSMGRYGEPRRICVGNAGQKCLGGCGPLACVTDYIGGGSHYWHLQCPACLREYFYDTYRFRLEAANG